MSKYNNSPIVVRWTWVSMTMACVGGGDTKRRERKKRKRHCECYSKINPDRRGPGRPGPSTHSLSESGLFD
jgi:hypothetical protein